MDSDNNDGISRRTFIVGVSAGVVGVTCASKPREKQPGPPDDAAKVVPATPREALVALCLLVGPWTTADRDIAEEFLERFLTEKRVEKFSEHAEAIAKLPSQLPNTGAERLDKIPMAKLSTAERDALVAVLHGIYSVEEVRFYVCGEPNAGTCMPDLSFIAAVPT